MTETTPRPRKSWGQNFLIDYNIQRKILDTAEIGPGERVVEIGPGRGILTKGLLERGAEVLAIEIDPLLVATLRQEIPSPPSSPPPRRCASVPLSPDPVPL
ncbi:MAG: hypothetical protein MPW16_17220 [Candidatus Manganitrophus sp.]|nr:MAG: hypothetical protein MPW16_17220 [Candidatus Manganitrophus sp.]